MNQTKRARGEEKVLGEFRSALEDWSGALDAHRLAPPDAGFAARLSALAQAAGELARACRDADQAGFDWTPHRAAGSRPPYELQPGTGRRGPETLWRRFDAAVATLSADATGRDILAVADDYAELAAAASELTDAVAKEDRASAPRRRARRTA
jgi:hypothetical protein